MTASEAPASRPSGFHVLTKPIGPICNLDCTYCFYLEKEKLYPHEHKWAMNAELLEEYIRQYIAAQDAGEVHFAWQGGEPTLLGVEFFQRAADLQRKHAHGKQVHNALQTNGTLLDDQWCEFFAREKFLVGLSIDGPEQLHDVYRVDKNGAGTFASVMNGLKFLKKHAVDFNTLTVVNRENGDWPLDVYRFLKEIGSRFMQFIPLVERAAAGVVNVKVRGIELASPPVAGISGDAPGMDSPVTPWSVESKQYGRFLCAIFDAWVRRDVGRTFVQIFDVALSSWMGLGSPLCVFAEKCGVAVAMEHNGDLYSCDHYVYPQYKLGNVMNTTLADMLASPRQIKFGNDKSETLPAYCRNCEVRFACNGECPKHRFVQTPDGEPGLNYLCAGYKQFFNHIDPYMKTMAELLRAGRPADEIMGMFQPPTRPGRAEATGRNHPCPCGSGRKFKKCCGANSQTR